MPIFTLSAELEIHKKMPSIIAPLQRTRNAAATFMALHGPRDHVTSSLQDTHCHLAPRLSTEYLPTTGLVKSSP